MLVTCKDSFHAEHDRTISCKRALLDQCRGIALRARKRMVVADQDNVGRVQRSLHCLGVEQRIIAAESLIELAQILAAVVRILSADFALHSGQRVQLRDAPAGSQICRGCHKVSF